MAFLDFQDNAWQGEIGDVSRVLVGEQRYYKYEGSAGNDVIDGTRLYAAGTNYGLYQYQIAMNPGSDLGSQINFIENPALTGALTAAPGVPGTRNIIGTLYLPLTGDGNAPYIRNILQSHSTSGTAPTITGQKTTTGSAHITDEFVTEGDITSSTALSVTVNALTIPARARIYLEDTDSDTLAMSGSAAHFDIVGIDHADNAITERITCTSCENGDVVIGNIYFKDITSINPIGWSAGQFGLRFYDPSYTITFFPYDLSMNSFLSLEIDKGNVPFTYRGCYATGARIEVRERDELLQLAIDMDGRTSYPYENLAGTQVPEVTESNKSTVASTDYRTDLSVEGLSNLEIISEHAMIGARTLMTIGDSDVRLPVINATLDFGINTERSPVLTGDPNIAGAPYRRRRQPILSGELHFSKQSNLSIDALNAIQQDYLKINFSNKARGGFPYEHEITFRKGQFQEVGDPTVDSDIIRQRFSVLGLPSAQGLSDDLSWKAVYSKYAAVANY